MKILILAAMDKEISLLSSIFNETPEEKNDNGQKILKGHIGKNEAIIAKCGIGKVNAAVNCQKLIEKFSPQLILNSGVAGGAGIPVGSVLIGERIAYHDVWCGPSTPYGEADGFPLFFESDSYLVNKFKEILPEKSFYCGLICSGDKFITTADEIKFIRSHFPDVMAVDMESAAIAQVSMMFSIPFLILRVVSDTPGEGENISQYKNFWEEAPRKTFSVVRQLILSLEGN